MKIREAKRSDLGAITSLYRRVMGSGMDDDALERWFERTLFDHPWTDLGIPSLVAEDGGELDGFIGSHPRPIRIDGRDGILACSGQLVVTPDARRLAPGALLLRTYLDGPQDLTITDGATGTVRAIWERLGGQASFPRSVEWHRPLRPGTLAATALSRRGGRGGRPAGMVGGLGRAADRLAEGLPDTPLQRSGPPAEALAERGGPTDPLDGASMVASLEAIGGRSRLRPAYTLAGADWLLAALAAERPRGELRARLVRDPDGRPLGWFVYYLDPGALSPVISVVAGDERGGAAVLEALFEDAREGGAAWLRGRLEPRLAAPLFAYDCPLRYTGEALVHSADPATLALALAPDAILTRLEGEWWMGPHLG